MAFPLNVAQGLLSVITFGIIFSFSTIYNISNMDIFNLNCGYKRLFRMLPNSMLDYFIFVFVGL